MSENKVYISGSGGGKGGGHTPSESPDSLRSRQKARIVEMISEGEIVGLVEGLKGVYLDDVPIQNDNGTYNYEGVTLITANGTPTQDYIPGFSETESEHQVGVEIKYGLPYTFNVPNRESSSADAVRVTIGIPGLTNIEEDGDIVGTSVTISIQVQHNGGGFVTKLTDTISGKTTSKYQRSYRVSLPQDQAGPWDVRVIRQTADSSSAKLVNGSWIDSYTIISETKMRYTNTAIVGVEINAEQFSNIPVRAYHCKGLRIQVPTNYDPDTRAYTGLWDGSFKTAYSNNPAWVLYDLLTSRRYGLGRYIDPSLIDKWVLYQIGRYCDELVPDGYGGMEPRYTCNMFIQQREDAFKLIANIASIAHVAAYGTGGGIGFVQDAPRDPIALFTPANVINGRFEYSGASIKAQHNVVLVAWNDPADMYRQKIEYVEDADLIAKYGIVQTEVTAMGCTSRGQARRMGKAVLFAEKMESESISFAAGFDSYKIYPGAIFSIADPIRTRVRNGGRLLSATTTAITIDAPIDIPADVPHTLKVVLPDGSVEVRDVTSTGNNLTTITVTPAFTQEPVNLAMWVLESSDKLVESWVCLSAEEDVQKGTINVTGIAYVPEKYALIDAGEELPAIPEYNPYKVSPPPTNLAVSAYLNSSGSLDLLVSWSPAEGTRSAVVTWRKDYDNFEMSSPIQGSSYTIRNVGVGEYTIYVSTMNAIGIMSPPALIVYDVMSTSVLPDIQFLQLSQPFVDKFAAFQWQALSNASKYLVQIQVNGVTVREVVTTDNWYVYDYAESAADNGGIPARNFTIRVKGKYDAILSANWASLAVSNIAPPVPAVSVLAITGGFQVSAPLPADSDYAGMRVWAGTTNGFTPSDLNLAYDGVNNSVNLVDFQPGIPVYVRVAFYDVFGRTDLNISSQYTVTPLSNVADIDVVSSLPAVGTHVGKVVFLLTDEKLYRWSANNTWDTWVDGSDILASSVTAGKINVTQLSAISANMGTINAGNITLDQAGFIQGGASAYSLGAGFWMGYSGGAYKFRIGDPNGSNITWDGANLNIGTNIDYSNILNGPPANATRNVWMGAYNAGVQYQLGDTVVIDGTAWTYINQTPSTGNAPPTLPTTSNSWWGLFASQGPAGQAGVNGTRTAILEMYQAAATQPTTFPSGTSTYTWATGQFTAPGTPNSWSITPPTPGAGESLWVVRQLYSDQDTTTTSTVTWNATSCRVVADGVDGVDGQNGWRTAFLELYKWSAATPTTFPSGSSTYTWATGEFTAPGTPNGWSLTPGAAVPGQTLWACSVMYADQGTTTTSSVTWGTSTAYAVGAAGTDGASAKLAILTASSMVFQVPKTGPVTPDPITLTAYGQNVTGTPTFTVDSGTATLTYVSANVRTLAYTSMSTETVRIKITWDSQVDYVTITKVREGLDGAQGTAGLEAITTVFFNESHTLPALADGTVLSYLNSGTKIQVYEGTTLLTAGGVANGSFTVGAPVQNPLGSVASPGGVTYVGNEAIIGDHSGISAGVSTVTLTYPIVVKRANGTTTTYYRVQTLTKSLTGAKGDTGAPGTDGVDALTVIVTNEAHILSAASDGTVPAGNYTGSGTKVYVYEGATQLLANGTGFGKFTIGTITQVPAASITVGAKTYSGYEATVANHSAMNPTIDTVVLTLPINITRLDGTLVTLYKTQTITKSKAGTPGVDGVDGAGGPKVTVYPDRALSFTATNGTLDNSQANIVFTAIDEGITSPTFTWSFTGFETPPVNSGTNIQTITAAQFGTSKTVTVKCTVSGAEGTVYDILTVVRLEKNTAAGNADSTSGALATGVVLNSGGITMSAGGAIKGGMTSATDTTHAGYFLGYEGGVYRFSLRSAAGLSAARLEVGLDVIKVFDEMGTLRVKLGNLLS